MSLLDKLIATASQNPSDLESLLEDNSNSLSVELAESAHKRFQQAVEEGQFDKLKAIARVGSAVYFHLNEDYKGYSFILDHYWFLYNLANTITEYEAVRQFSLEIFQLLQSELNADARWLCFKAAILAANCSLYSAQIQESSRVPFLRDALSLLAAASEKGSSDTPTILIQEFSSLLAAVYRGLKQSWLEEPEKKQNAIWFSKIALALESFVPTKIEFDDIYKTIMVTEYLATIQYRYGNIDIARERYEYAAIIAEKENDIELWIQVAWSYYLDQRDVLPRYIRGSSEQIEYDMRLLGLRHKIYSQAELWRSQFRSRIGRLWASQEFEHKERIFLLDEFNMTHMLPASQRFDVIEFGKAQMLLDQMTNSFKDILNEELFHEVSNLERSGLRFEPERIDTKNRIEYFEIRLASGLPIGRPHRKQFKHITLLNEIEEIYKDQNCGFQRVGERAKLDQVQEALRPGELLVEYKMPLGSFKRDDELFILAITHDNIRIFRVPDIYQRLVGKSLNEIGFGGSISIGERQPITLTPVTEAIALTRIKIQKEKHDIYAEDYLVDLFDILIYPLLDKGFSPQEFSRWIIVPHGPLHSIPYQALFNPKTERYLIEDVALTIVPSASVWFNLQSRESTSPNSFFGLGNPLSLGTSWTPLPQAEEELEQVCDILKPLECKTYTFDEATKDIIHEEMSGKSIVHFATHGAFPESDVIDFHQIVLAPTVANDGLLHAEELRRMDLKSTQLVVLNICDGGLYRVGPGDEPYGLIPALLTAGTQNVLGTLWPIDDAIGRSFIVEFYRNLLEKGPAEALRQACIKFIREGHRIRDWAGFALIGPGRTFH